MNNHVCHSLGSLGGDPVCVTYTTKVKTKGVCYYEHAITFSCLKFCNEDNAGVFQEVFREW